MRTSENVYTQARPVQGRRSPEPSVVLAADSPQVVPLTLGPYNLVALPVEVNLRIYQGDDFTFKLEVSEPDGQPADLAGATLRSQIRVTAATDTIAGTFVTEIDGSSILLHLTSAVSGALPPQSVWDCELTQDGRVTTLTAGRIALTPEVTR